MQNHAERMNALTRLQSMRNRVLPALAVLLFALLLLWVILAPSESRLGNLVKLIYVHGALVWIGLVTFSVAGCLGLVALVILAYLSALAFLFGAGAMPVYSLSSAHSADFAKPSDMVMVSPSMPVSSVMEVTLRLPSRSRACWTPGSTGTATARYWW